MKVNPAIQLLIEKRVLENAVKKEPSGRLAASRLGWPLQWQMLHYFKVPQKEVDEYTLRKFARGNDVEDRIIEWVGQGLKTQVPCEYRGVVGFADLIMDYPIEIKSCTNLAFKFKQKEGTSRGHRLQGELYAKALGYDTFAIAYVASDDYRVLCFEEEVTGDTDAIIDRYEAQVALGTVPAFVAEEKWQADDKYSPYPEWTKLSELEIAAKLETLGVVVPTKLPLESN